MSQENEVRRKEEMARQWRAAARRYADSRTQRRKREQGLRRIEEPGAWRDVEEPKRVIQRAKYAGVEGVGEFLEKYNRPPSWPPIAPPQSPAGQLLQEAPEVERPPLLASVIGGTASELIRDPGGLPALRRFDTGNELVSSYYLVRGERARRTVARIVDKRGSSMGSGFLVGPGILMTNAHVLPRDWIAEGATAEFDFVDAGQDQALTLCSHELRPQEFFHVNGDLDYALVAVADGSAEGSLLSERGWIQLHGPSGKALVSERVNIIQHPEGRPQELALRDNQIVDFVDDFIHYRADTQSGSSGSPVWNDNWDLLALHHASVGHMNEDGEILTSKNGCVWDYGNPNDVEWIANEGVRISRIVADLHEACQDMPPDRAARIEAFLPPPEEPQRPFLPDLPPPQTPSSPTSEPGTDDLAVRRAALASWTAFDARQAAS
jgi:V8-like Glu-specific endopeptidase